VTAQQTEVGQPRRQQNDPVGQIRQHIRPPGHPKADGGGKSNGYYELLARDEGRVFEAKPKLCQINDAK
jgi:hypothetical protein